MQALQAFFPVNIAKFLKTRILKNIFTWKLPQNYLTTWIFCNLLLFRALCYSEAVVQGCSVKKTFLEISQNSHENTCARVSVLIKLNTSAGSFWHEKIRIFDFILFAPLLIFTLTYINPNKYLFDFKLARKKKKNINNNKNSNETKNKENKKHSVDTSRVFLAVSLFFFAVK